jgi:hypothetical protein
MIVNDGDPPSFFFSCYHLVCTFHVPIHIYIYMCMWNVWRNNSSLLVVCRWRVWFYVSSQTCYITRELYLHIEELKSFWICVCVFGSETNCLLKLRYVSFNPLRHEHQSVCVTIWELTYSSWTHQTAWFYRTYLKHSLRRLIDLSLSLLLFYSVCLSVSSWLTYV